MDTLRESEAQYRNDSRIVFRAENALIAEHMRFVLSVAGIPSAVIQGDPLRLGAALVDVYVQARDLSEALNVIVRPSNVPNGDWNCRRCGETVPASFDSCWNCGEHRLMSVAPAVLGGRRIDEDTSLFKAEEMTHV